MTRDNRNPAETPSILVVEDEIKIAKLLRDYLIADFPNTLIALQGNQALESIKKHPPDLILLDVMLPKMDGLEICRRVREFSNVPVIFLTAKSEERDRLQGFALQADDYIAKPFSPREVVARVKAVLRRSRTASASAATQAKISRGKVELDLEARVVKVSGRYVKPTPKEFEILKVLISRPNRVFTRDELLDKAMGYGYEGYDRTIDTHVKNLRRKMNEADPENKSIESIYGVGYRFNDLPETDPEQER